MTSALSFRARVDPLLTFLPVCNGFLRFTSGATPINLLTASYRVLTRSNSLPKVKPMETLTGLAGSVTVSPDAGIHGECDQSAQTRCYDCMWSLWKQTGMINVKKCIFRLCSSVVQGIYASYVIQFSGHCPSKCTNHFSPHYTGFPRKKLMPAFRWLT